MSFRADSAPILWYSSPVFHAAMAKAGTAADSKASNESKAQAELTMAAVFVRKQTLDMVSELHTIADSHAARAAQKLRATD